MNINYWIILLIIYLVSQWMRRRMKARQRLQAEEAASSRGEVETPEKEAKIPDWLRELGIFDVGEEEPEEDSEVVEKEGELAEPHTLREEIETYDRVTPPKRPTPEPEPPPVREISPVLPQIPVPAKSRERRLPSLGTGRMKPRWEMPGQKKHLPTSRFAARIHDPENLRELIVLREILGPPRVMHRHKPHLHF